METGQSAGTTHDASFVGGAVRRLTGADVAPFMELRQRALLAAPLAFGASPATDRFRSAGTTRELLERGERAPTFGAFVGERLVGSVGLVCEAAPKAAHRATVWGMFVESSMRGRGVGEALVRAVIAHAHTLVGIDWLQLDVSVVADAARRLYERCGFVAWGREPDGLRADGRSTDVLHMALQLRPPGPS